MHKRRRGQYFEIDAIIAIGILIVGLVYIRSLGANTKTVMQTEQYTEEGIKLLRNMKVGELNPAVYNYLKSSSLGYYTNPNNTIAKQIAIYYFKGSTNLTRNLTQEILDSLIPLDYGYSVHINSPSMDDYALVYNRTEIRRNQDISVSRTMITGLDEGRPIIGKLAKIYFKNPRNRLSDYYFFGGFIGQGNISVIIALPPNMNATGSYFEGYLGDDFILKINSEYCDTLKKTKTMSNITAKELYCTNFHEGNNLLEFYPQSNDTTDQYIGGGFFRVDYVIGNAQPASNWTRKFLPGISGTINLYDSISVQGDLVPETFKIFLKFNKSDYEELNFNLANETIFKTSQFGQFNVTLNASNISAQLLSDLSNNNIPIKIGLSESMGSGSGDIVWVTDMSDSMSDCSKKKNDYSIGFDSCGFYESFDSGLDDSWKKSHPSYIWNKVSNISDKSQTCLNTFPPQINLLEADPGLVAWWKLDGNYNDELGRNTGTSCIKGSCPTKVPDRFGNPDKAYNFASGGIIIPDSLGLRSPYLTQQLTISAWIRLDSTTQWNMLLMKGASTSAPREYSYGFTSEGYSHFAYYSAPCANEGNCWYYQNDKSSVYDGKWHHVAVTLGGNQFTYYIDGKKTSAWWNKFPLLDSPNVPVTIGGESGGSWRLNGAIDDLKIFNRTLSADDISILYENAAETITNRTFIRKLLLLPLSNFTFELGYEFMNQSLPKEKNTTFEIVFLNESGQIPIRISLNDAKKNITLSVGDLIAWIDPAAWTNESRLVLEKYGNLTKVYLDNNLVISQEVPYSGNVSQLYITNYNYSSICYDNFKIYDETKDPWMETGSSNYLTTTEPAYLYEKILPEKMYNSNPQQVAECAPGEVCYCQQGKWTTEIICTSTSPYYSCCQNRNCGTLLSTFSAVDNKTNFLAQNIVTNNNGACNVDDWNSLEATGVIGSCRTECSAYSPYVPGDCSSSKYYNCSFDYCYSKFDLITNIKKGQRCNTDILSLSNYNDINITEDDYRANCISQPIQVPSVLPSEVLVCQAGALGCLNADYKKCTITYQKTSPKKASCSPGTRCICSGEECYDYNVSINRFRSYQSECPEANIRKKWTYLGYDFLKQDSSAKSCFQQSSTSAIYSCRNDFGFGLLSNNPFSAPLSGSLYFENMYYSSGFLQKNFDIPPTELSNLDRLNIDFFSSIFGSNCYINNNLMTYHLDRFSSSNIAYSYSIPASIVFSGTNTLTCQIKNYNDWRYMVNLSLQAIRKDGTKRAIFNYTNDWTYSYSTELLSGRTPNFLYSSGEYAKPVESCMGKFPWNMNQRFSISSAAYSPDQNNYDKYLKPSVRKLSDMFGGVINQQSDGLEIPESFWDSADVLLIDFPANADLIDKIKNNASHGKIILVNENLYNMIPKSGDQSYSSYGFSSKKFQEGSGYIIGITGSASSLANYLSYYNYHYPNELTDFTAHIYTTIYPVWATSSDAGSLSCPAEYCVPGKTTHCEICEYYKDDLARYLSQRYITQLADGTGNRIATIAYGSNLSCGRQILDFTSNLADLSDAVNDYYPNCGATCTACAIDKSMEITSSKKRQNLVLPPVINNSVFFWLSMDSADSLGNPVDSSSSKFATDCSKEPVYTYAGKHGRAFILNQDGQSIKIKEQEKLKLDNFTIAFWVMTNSTAQNQYLFSFLDQTYDYGYAISTDGRNISLIIVDDTSVAYTTSGNKAINDGNWHFITAGYTKEGLSISIDSTFYVGGKKEIPYTFTGIFPVIGNSMNKQNPFNGTIDEFMFFNRSLEPSEISILYSLSAENLRRNYIVLLSDGEANYALNQTTKASYPNTTMAKQQAIDLSRLACTELNMTLFTISFGSTEGSSTLQAMADVNSDAGCNGTFYEGIEKEELNDVFSEIKSKITFNLQGMNTSLNQQLYPESYIEYEQKKPQYDINNTIRFSSEIQLNNSCNMERRFYFSAFKYLEDMKVTSYSGNLWTNHLIIGNNSYNRIQVFNISQFNTDKISQIGDPFMLGISSNVLSSAREISIDLDLTQGGKNYAPCSPQDKLIYTAYLPTTFELSADQEEADGCNWEITLLDKGEVTLPVPTRYTGNRACNFNKFKPEDSENAIDLVTYQLLKSFDTQPKDGKLDFTFDPKDVEITISIVDQLPYMWGPAMLEIRVWK